jgi:MA3 domain
MLALLEALSRAGEVSPLQVYKGFQRFVDQLDDLALDTPHLHDTFQTFYSECIARGIIDPADQSVLDDAAASRGVTTNGKASSVATVDGSVASGGGGGSEAAVAVRSVGAFKAAALKTVQEYFDSSDAQEVARILEVRARFALCTAVSVERLSRCACCPASQSQMHGNWCHVRTSGHHG